MGCCEARSGSDRYDMNVKYQYNNSFLNGNNKDKIKIGTKPDVEYMKPPKKVNNLKY
jgi:hypothetical protein